MSLTPGEPSGKRRMPRLPSVLNPQIFPKAVSSGSPMPLLGEFSLETKSGTGKIYPSQTSPQVPPSSGATPAEASGGAQQHQVGRGQGNGWTPLEKATGQFPQWNPAPDGPQTFPRPPRPQCPRRPHLLGWPPRAKTGGKRTGVGVGCTLSAPRNSFPNWAP